MVFAAYAKKAGGMFPCLDSTRPSQEPSQDKDEGKGFWPVVDHGNE
jgi:hypothetical protein